MPRLSDTFLSRERASTVKARFPYKGVTFTIGSFHNEDFQKALGELPLDASKDDRLALYAKHVLLDVDGLENDDGTPFESTRENRVALMRDFTEVANLIVAYSQNTDNFLGTDAIVGELGN